MSIVKSALKEYKIFGQEWVQWPLRTQMELFHVVLSAVPEIIHTLSATTKQFLTLINKISRIWRRAKQESANWLHPSECLRIHNLP
jgi:hypothetical protein